MNTPRFAFFGTSVFSVIVLDELLKAGFKPDVVIATPDKPAGRKLILTPPPAKVWALEQNIPVLQPEKLKDEHFIETLKATNVDVFIVASYGKIIPKSILDIPKHGALNVHPSLLPKLRGASPLQTSILEDMKHTGVTIMLMDEEMDHGPIITQKELDVEPWPPTTQELKEILGPLGGKMLVEILEPWIAGKFEAKPQDHSQATFTKKIEKADGLIDLTQDPYKNFLKIQAFNEWPSAYFFTEKNGKQMRVIIKKAIFKDGALEILRVVPEGKREMDYKDFTRN